VEVSPYASDCRATWQALACEANARVASVELDLEKARDCITGALLRMEGCEVPLAVESSRNWRRASPTT
jgi:hypothetical protein